jgi:hypothetical protein
VFVTDVDGHEAVIERTPLILTSNEDPDPMEYVPLDTVVEKLPLLSVVPTEADPVLEEEFV